MLNKQVLLGLLVSLFITHVRAAPSFITSPAARGFTTTTARTSSDPPVQPKALSVCLWVVPKNDAWINLYTLTKIKVRNSYSGLYETLIYTNTPQESSGRFGETYKIPMPKGMDLKHYVDQVYQQLEDCAQGKPLTSATPQIFVNPPPQNVMEPKPTTFTPPNPAKVEHPVHLKRIDDYLQRRQERTKNE